MSLARRPGPSQRIRVQELLVDGDRNHEDRVAVEEPLELRITWPGADPRRLWLTMRTPGHDFELAAGWLLHEGIATEPTGIAYCTDDVLRTEQEFNVVTITLAAPPARLPQQHEAMSAGSSACGVCGSDTIEEVLTKSVPGHSRYAGQLPEPQVLRGLPDTLRQHQPLFDRTGGVHAAGLFTADGQVVVVREDIGRHNAVDKVTGSRVLSGSVIAEAALVVSGRAGFELVQKAVASGVGCLVAVGAPTSLAVDLAQRADLPLFGFTSERRTVRYA